MRINNMGAIAATLVLAGINVQAQSYDADVGLIYSSMPNDDKTHQSATTLGGTYYFKTIRADPSLPFGELDFLQRSSQVNLFYSNLSIGGSPVFSDTTSSIVGLGGMVFVNRFVLGLSTHMSSVDLSVQGFSFAKYNVSRSSNGFEIGYMVMPNTMISFSNNTVTSNYLAIGGLPPVDDFKTTNNGLKSHAVISLVNKSFMVLNLSFHHINRSQSFTSESNSEIAANLRYYPLPNYFIEGGYAHESGYYAYGKGNTLSAGAGYAFTPYVNVLLYASKFSADDRTLDAGGHTVGLNANLRF